MASSKPKYQGTAHKKKSMGKKPGTGMGAGKTITGAKSLPGKIAATRGVRRRRYKPGINLKLILLVTKFLVKNKIFTQNLSHVINR